MGFLDNLKDIANKDVSEFFQKSSDKSPVNKISADTPLAVDSSLKKSTAQQHKLNKKLAKQQEKDAKKKEKQDPILFCGYSRFQILANCSR